MAAETPKGQDDADFKAHVNMYNGFFTGSGVVIVVVVGVLAALAYFLV